MKELQDIARLSDRFISVELVDESLFDWNVKLHQVDKDSVLWQDMKETNTEFILLNLTFPDNFPFSPPFMRVLSPRLENGYVLDGGAICMELLTPRGWSSAYTVEAVMRQFAASLVKGQVSGAEAGGARGWPLGPLAPGARGAVPLPRPAKGRRSRAPPLLFPERFLLSLPLHPVSAGLPLVSRRSPSLWNTLSPSPHTLLSFLLCRFSPPALLLYPLPLSPNPLSPRAPPFPPSRSLPFLLLRPRPRLPLSPPPPSPVYPLLLFLGFSPNS
ncbi:ubiquitin-conjugating enzyme E2Q-like protein 1 [Physeter macrocephalus]|uniref:Ubiquitin-conjugating enzyme E2Q-like protein 1 n=1 Tax=Physeter macrocephalus TaxID=9755 RepID=A0A455B2X8_PHYMC|nr:ubiquitin-conjugating enzyme E2Q-like protein 1 [Physeter catodon]|eukprot:XP_028342443.1 ubiquitin-conjugating enzyme E2Q-like protein 1 [Physeter catodon]